MFIEMRAVEVDETMRIVREVAGDPVDQNAQARLVALVDEILEVVGLAIAAGGCEQADGLVPPRAIEGIFVDRHQLDVGETEALGVGNQVVGQFTIGEITVVLLRLALPRAEVHLVDGDRRVPIVVVRA